MPPGPLISSPRLQSLVIAAVMTLLLALSLGAAHLVSQHRGGRSYDNVVAQAGPPNTTVGELKLWIPDVFTPLSSVPASINLPPMQVTAAYAQKDSPGQILVVGRLQNQVPRAPLRVLHEVLAACSSAQPITQIHRAPVRTRTMLGCSFIGMRPRDANRFSPLVLTLLSDDGQNYWLVGIIGTLPLASSNGHGLRALDQLVASMCQNALTTRYTAAIEEDFAEAGLAVLDEPTMSGLGLAAVAETGRTDRAPLLLRGTTAPGLQWLRVIAAPDSGSDDPNDPLSPQHLLAQQFQHINKRAPSGQEFWAGSIGNIPAWRISFTATDSEATAALGLVWDLWYARLGNGQGLLLETRCEPHLLEANQALAPRLIEALHHRALPPSDDFSFNQAANRGQQVAEALRAQLARRYKPQTLYAVVRFNGQVCGSYCEILSVQRSSLLGRSLEMPPDGQLQYHSAWAMSRDGTQRLEVMRVLEQAGTELRLREQNRLVLGDGRLTLYRAAAGGQQIEAWTWPMRPALVHSPDYWPCESMHKMGPGAALVWMSRRPDEPPSPHWATLTPTPGPERSASGWQLSLRPMMAIDGNMLEFNAGGELRHAVLRKPEAVAGGSVALLVQMVDRSTLLAQAPAMAAALQAWEKLPDAAQRDGKID